MLYYDLDVSYSCWTSSRGLEVEHCDHARGKRDVSCCSFSERIECAVCVALYQPFFSRGALELRNIDSMQFELVLDEYNEEGFR